MMTILTKWNLIKNNNYVAEKTSQTRFARSKSVMSISCFYFKIVERKVESKNPLCHRVYLLFIIKCLSVIMFQWTVGTYLPSTAFLLTPLLMTIMGFNDLLEFSVKSQDGRYAIIWAVGSSFTIERRGSRNSLLRSLFHWSVAIATIFFCECFYV